MRCFLTLLQKEWRDARAITLASAILAPLALVAAEHWFLREQYAEFAAVVLVPGLIGLFAAVIASDVIAADVSTRRSHSMAALPTSARTLWLSKVVALVALTLLFGAWVHLFEILHYGFAQSWDRASAFTAGIPAGLTNLVIAVPIVAAVLLFSTLLERGFACVCGGVVLIVGIAASAFLVDWHALEFVPTETEARWVGVLLAAVFLGGSAMAFIRGPVHVASLLRRSVLAFALPLAVLVPTTVATAAVLVERRSVEPGDPDVTLKLIETSDDGEHLILNAWRRRRDAQHRTWVLHVPTGRITQLPHTNLTLDQRIRWTDEGHLRMWQHERPSRFSRKLEPTLHRTIDLATGQVVRTRSYDQVVADEGNNPFAYDTGWGRIERRPEKQIIQWHGHDLDVEVQQRVPVQLSRKPGFAVHTQSAARGAATQVVLHDLRAGTSKVVVERAGTCNTYFSPKGEYLRVLSSSRCVIVRVRDGNVAWDGARSGCFPHWGGGSVDRFALLFGSDVPTRVLDLETGQERELAENPNSYGAPWDLVHARASGEIVQIHSDGSIRLHESDGDERTLYSPRKE